MHVTAYSGHGLVRKSYSLMALQQRPKKKTGYMLCSKIVAKYVQYIIKLCTTDTLFDIFCLSNSLICILYNTQYSIFSLKLNNFMIATNFEHFSLKGLSQKFALG